MNVFGKNVLNTMSSSTPQWKPIKSEILSYGYWTCLCELYCQYKYRCQVCFYNLNRKIISGIFVAKFTIFAEKYFKQIRFCRQKVLRPKIQMNINIMKAKKISTQKTIRQLESKCRLIYRFLNSLADRENWRK